MLTGPELKPRNSNKPKKLVILFHGLGADGANLIDLASVMNRFIADTHFIAPNAPFPYDMGTGGYQWFSRQSRSEEIALEGLNQVEPIVNKFIDQQLSRFSLSEEDLAVVGFSQGTMVALHSFLRRSKAVSLIVGFSGALIAAHTLDSELKSKPPVLLIHGEADEVLPASMTLDAEKELKARGVEAEAYIYPNLAHHINQEGFGLAINRLRQIFNA